MNHFTWCYRTLTLVCILLAGCAQSPAISQTPVLLTEFPATATPGPVIEFEGKDLADSTVKISDYAGQVVLVNFWATWCSPCKEEMPVLQEYYEDHQDAGFTVVAINTGDSPEEAAAFVEKYRYTFPVWSDPPGNRLIALGIRGLPYSLVLDQQGKRVAQWYGATNTEHLESIITPLLEQQ